jgi:flagellar biosynthesis/type III secretory pathway protein FliH
LRSNLVRCRQVDVMNELLRPAANTDDREDAEQERGCAEEHGMSVEAARNEAEQVRQLAEDARDVRDQQREALETIRQERERLRESAETARAANEQNRGAAEAARHAVVDGVRASADTLNATLEQMKMVEEMRRTLRDIRDVHKLDAN